MLPSPQTLADSSRARRWTAVLIGSGAMLLCLYFFCPRFSLWRGLEIQESRFNPEVNRAYDVLQQVDHPFARIDNPSNKAIRWRLLFPLIWHYSSLPRRGFFVVPWIGVWLTLVFIADWAIRQTNNLWASTAMTVLAGTTAWFFVSTGWLAYCDSWLILALLVVAFHRNRALVLAACFLAPWIDERFLFQLPLIWALRAADYGREGRPRLLRQAAAESLAAAPYLVLRGVFVLTGRDVQTHEFLSALVLDRRIVWLLRGYWEGLRAGWIAVFGVSVLLWRRGRRLELAAIAAGTVIALVLNSHFSTDGGRTTSELLPLVLFGCVELFRSDALKGVRLLGALAAFNVVFPACNYFLGWSIPVYYFPREWERWNDPPAEVNAKSYLQHGVASLAEKDASSAEHLFTIALKLDPGLALAHYNMGVLALQRQDWARARASFDTALACDPKLPDAWFWRSYAKRQQNDLAGARSDLEQSLRVAPPAWPGRPSAEQMLSAPP